MVDVIESVDGAIGHHPDLATEALHEMDMTDHTKTTSEEKMKAVMTARQK